MNEEKAKYQDQIIKNAEIILKQFEQADILQEQNIKQQDRIEELEEQLKGAIAAYGEWKQMYETSKTPEEIENRKLIATVADQIRKRGKKIKL